MISQTSGSHWRIGVYDTERRPTTIAPVSHPRTRWQAAPWPAARYVPHARHTEEANTSKLTKLETSPLPQRLPHQDGQGKSATQRRGGDLDPERRRLVLINLKDGTLLNAALIQERLATPWKHPGVWHAWPRPPVSDSP